MKLSEAALAAGLSVSLTLTGCSENAERSPEIHSEMVDEALLEAHNARLRDNRTESFEALSEAAGRLLLSTAAEPDLESIRQQIKRGFTYEEPGNSLATRDAEESAEIRLIPFFEKDLELGYEIVEEFGESGEGVFIRELDTILISAERPLELQVSTLAHELTHTHQDQEGTYVPNCLAIEPEALRLQAEITPYIFSEEVINSLETQADQTTVSYRPDGLIDTVDFGDTKNIQLMVEQYSPDPETSTYFSDVAQSYVTWRAIVGSAPDRANQLFDNIVGSTYCARPS